MENSQAWFNFSRRHSILFSEPIYSFMIILVDLRIILKTHQTT